MPELSAGAIATAAAPPPAAPSHDGAGTRGNARLVAALAGSAAVLAALPWLVQAMAGSGLAVALLASSGAMAIAASAACRLAGFGLPPLRIGGRSIAVGLGQGIGVFGWIILALVVAGRLTGGGAGGATAASLATGASLLLVQCAGEEMFFRGWLQTAMRRLMPDATALPLTAFIFGASHLLGGNARR